MYLISLDICLTVLYVCLSLELNNGLREAVVAKSFLFLSTFFIQVLFVSYKLQKLMSILFMLIVSETCA